MFTEKLSRKSRVVPPAVSPYTVSLLINILLYWCDNTLLLQFQVHIRVPFSYCTFCRFWQMYDNIYPSLQYCKNPLYSMYWALSFLWAPKNHWFFFFFPFSFFLFSMFLMLQHLGPCWTRKDCPSQSRPVLRDGTWFPCQHTSNMQVNESRAQGPSSVWLLGFRRQNSFPIIIPGIRHLEMARHPRAHCEDSSFSPWLSLPFPMETTVMPPARAWSLPFLLPTLVLPHVALHAVTCLLLLETMSNKLSFQWQSSPHPAVCE